MLVVFHSRAAADVVMLVEHALMVMRVAGREYGSNLPERGVFTQEQIPAAIAAIEAAVELDRKRHADGQPKGFDDEDSAGHPITEPVTFRQRSWPLLAMLRASREQGSDVTWEPASMW